MKIPEILMIETVHQPGSLARVLQVIADAGLTIDHLQSIRREQGRTLWEITFEMDEETDRSLYARIDELPIASGFGAIQLEDFAAPQCFAIESGLRARRELQRCGSPRWR